MKKIFAFILFSLFSFLLYGENLDKNVMSFWNLVEENELKYFGSEKATDKDWESLYKSIRTINKGLSTLIMDEIIDGKKRFIITTGCTKSLFSLVDNIVEKAPSLKSFKIYSLAPRLTKFEPFYVDDVPLTVDNFLVHFDKPNKDGKYELIYILPEEHRYDIRSDDSGNLAKAYEKVAYFMTLQVLGERLMTEKVGSAELLPPLMIMPGIPMRKLYDEIK